MLIVTPSGGVVQVNNKTGGAIVTLISAVDCGYGELGVLYMPWILVTMLAGMVQ